MDKQKLFSKIIFFVFYPIIVLMMVAFIILDIQDYMYGDTWMYSNTIKYILMIMIGLFSLLHIFINKDKKDTKILFIRFIAMLCTFIADTFLLMINDHYIVGLIIFIIAHLMHAFANSLINKNDKKLNIIFIMLRIFVSVPLIVILVNLANGQDNVIYGLVGIYATQLFFNFVESIIYSIISSKENRLQFIILAIGFLLFIGCDIFVGLFTLYGTDYFLPIWIFYIPSQVLIVSSHFINQYFLNKK